MSHLRFSRRMYEQFPYGNEYGCAVTRYERRDGHRFVVPVALLCALACVLIIALEKF
jgi:hypothetical protein